MLSPRTGHTNIRLVPDPLLRPSALRVRSLGWTLGVTTQTEKDEVGFNLDLRCCCLADRFFNHGLTESTPTDNGQGSQLDRNIPLSHESVTMYYIPWIWEYSCQQAVTTERKIYGRRQKLELFDTKNCWPSPTNKNAQVTQCVVFLYCTLHTQSAMTVDIYIYIYIYVNVYIFL